MQKKLLAVAVAGALGAPALAFAQNATVNVYGVMYFEYASVKQGNTQPAPLTPGANLVRTDTLQNPGSAIGFRGEEKLGGGASVWWQCESTADFRGLATAGFCSRNSAVGVKSNYGNLFGGIWDTPFKRVTSDMIGANQAGGDTGIYGVSNVLFGNSTGLAAANATNATFRRRQTDLITYDTPNFGGFSASGAMTTGNLSTANTSATTGNKPRLWSFSAQYKTGPLNIYGSYERHKDFLSIAAGGRSDTESGWVIGGSYVFASSFKLGALYTRQKWDAGTSGAPIDAHVNAWYVAADWKISGPHGLRASWAHADDVKGSGPAAIFAPGVGGTAAAGAVGAGPITRPGVGDGTGAQIYQIKYIYTLSKRTEAGVGFVKLDNKSNANYNLTGMSANGFGQDQNAFVVSLYHTF